MFIKKSCGKHTEIIFFQFVVMMVIYHINFISLLYLNKQMSYWDISIVNLLVFPTFFSFRKKKDGNTLNFNAFTTTFFNKHC